MHPETSDNYRSTSNIPVPEPMHWDQAMTELNKLGYNSDSKNWLGLLRLMAQGYIKPRDLQNQSR